jgi:hypothetical protein
LELRFLSLADLIVGLLVLVCFGVRVSELGIIDVGDLEGRQCRTLPADLLSILASEAQSSSHPQSIE